VPDTVLRRVTTAEMTLIRTPVSFKVPARIAAISWLIKLSTAGASFADWTGKDRNAGGLGWGDGPVAAVLAVLIVAGVASLTVSGSDRAKEVELGPLLAGES
jgi:Repeat of Unknown Function (DUF347)